MVTKLVVTRSPWPQWFLAASAFIIGARVRVEGKKIGQHSLLLSNHVSWLDILVLGGATNCAFVSKKELGHPLVQWLSDQNGSVYVNRSDRKGAKDQAVAIARALDRPKPVLLFPEGTTGPGSLLLEFRSTLLEAAKLKGEKLIIRPIAVDYGERASEIAWWNETGTKNVVRLLGRRGSLPVVIHLLPQLKNWSDRKQLAAKAREAIAGAIGFKSPVQSPIDGPR